MTNETILRIAHVGTPEAEAILHRVPIDELTPDDAVSARTEVVFGIPLSPEAFVERVRLEVRARGDDALREIGARLGETVTGSFETSREEIEAAYQHVSAQFVADLRVAADRIERFHRQQPHGSWLDFGEGLGQVVRPLDRVGLYAPSGRGAYPGVHRVFKLGGAQAICAMAYGTQSVPKVDKILGPGNLFVVLAKRRVYGAVDIDQLPGPTETLVVADGTADAEEVASDLLAQAEHDPLATSVLITTSMELATAVADAVRRQLETLPTAAVARESLTHRGGAIVTSSVAEAIALA
ncbi:MAG: histidinol dehydrogenase, partial [Proteobacteria bacterium]|nr:histidinol dehydrogenase [Pseudomonadota bacterium]